MKKHYIRTTFVLEDEIYQKVKEEMKKLGFHHIGQYIRYLLYQKFE